MAFDIGGGISIDKGDYVIFAEGKAYLIKFDAAGNPTIIKLTPEQLENCKNIDNLLDHSGQATERPIILKAKCA